MPMGGGPLARPRVALLGVLVVLAPARERAAVSPEKDLAAFEGALGPRPRWRWTTAALFVEAERRRREAGGGLAELAAIHQRGARR